MGKEKIMSGINWLAALTIFTCGVLVTLSTGEEGGNKLKEPVFNSDGGHDSMKRIKRNAAASTNLQSFFQEVNQFGALDVVFIIERSSNVGKSDFNRKLVPFVQSIIRNYIYIAPNRHYTSYTRVSLITYDQEITLHFDGVEGNEMTKCDLVESEDYWRNVTYVDGPTANNAADTAGAINKAMSILTRGRQLRNEARSHIFLLSSGYYRDEEMRRLSSQYNNWYYAYIVALRYQSDLTRMASALATQVVYGSYDDWDRAMDDAVLTYHAQVEKPPNWTPYNGPTCGCSSGCYCDTITGYTRCQCATGYLDQYGQCQSPCDSSPCPQDLFECRPILLSYTCACSRTLGNVGCDPLRINDCRQNPCQNGGRCVDGIHTYSCMCTMGYTGKHCQTMDANFIQARCTPTSCSQGQQCQQEANGIRCIDIPVVPPIFPVPPVTPPKPVPTTRARAPPSTPPIITTTERKPPTTTHRPTPPFPSQHPDVQKTTTKSVSVQASVDQEDGFLSGLDNKQRLLLIILPSAGVGFLVLIMGIGGLIYVLVKKDKHKPDKCNMSGLTETTSIASHNPSLMTFDSKCYKDEGTPGAPKAKLSKDDEANKITYGNFDDVMYDNEAIQRGMEDWYAYVLELYHNQGLNRILIVRLDGEKWVLSPGTKLHMNEIEMAYKLLTKSVHQGTLMIQGREFGIVGNEDFVMVAHTFRNTKLAQEIGCATKTRQFVIVATADFSSDNGRCRRKVVELKEHILNQGL